MQSETGIVSSPEMTRAGRSADRDEDNDDEDDGLSDLPYPRLNRTPKQQSHPGHGRQSTSSGVSSIVTTPNHINTDARSIASIDSDLGSSNNMRWAAGGSGNGDVPATPLSATSSIYPSGSFDEEGAKFLIARLEAQKKLDSPETKTTWDVFTTQLRTSFQLVRDSVTSAEETSGEVDWDFWGRVMNDYESVARKHSRTLARKLQFGIPDAIRGMVWQLMCKGKSTDLENAYSNLLTRVSVHEKLIQRDLARTFPKHEYFQSKAGQEALFNVIKAYSLYDLEVGYCQGISFLVGALLLNMPEEEAFCCLVRLMKAYNFRDLYTPQMSGLQLRLYQFDSLLRELLPVVDRHLEAEGIVSSMYASQWFMTLFAYRFPLDIVFRIMDIVFAEGIETMFRFALALLKKNQDHLLTLDFESLLEFLKNGLFDVYVSSNSVNALIQDASAVRVTKSRLDKLALEFDELQKKNDPERLEAQQLRILTRHLQDQVKRVESAYEQLNREHITLANEFVDYKVVAERNAERCEELTIQVEGLKRVLADDRNSAERAVKDEMDALMRKNLELTRRNAEYQDQILYLEDLLTKTKLQYAEAENDRQDLLKKWEKLENSETWGDLEVFVSDLQKEVEVVNEDLRVTIFELRQQPINTESTSDSDDDESEDDDDGDAGENYDHEVSEPRRYIYSPYPYSREPFSVDSDSESTTKYSKDSDVEEELETMPITTSIGFALHPTSISRDDSEVAMAVVESGFEEDEVTEGEGEDLRGAESGSGEGCLVEEEGSLESDDEPGERAFDGDEDSSEQTNRTS
ncbi:GTPase-activating protein [Quaeritorhiza haematococci]|nr:GTPase-activating protein [Quaeritorhiza haematococci]